MNHNVYFVRHAGLALFIAVASVVPGMGAEPESPPTLQFPKIDTYGAVVALPSAEERPRVGGKVVFDTTAAAPGGKANRGLESAARLVNIYELEQMATDRPKIAVILHFNATASALNDSAHAKTTSGGPNPNRELVEKLLANGVEVWVCGQSLIRSGHALADVLPGIRVAHSAMVFNMNRQTDGWATLGVY